MDKNFYRKKISENPIKFAVRVGRFVANNLFRVSSLSWNKRRYSKDKEHRMCACYTSGPEGRKVAPVLCNRDRVTPLGSSVVQTARLLRLYNMYLRESNLVPELWNKEKNKREESCKIYQRILVFLNSIQYLLIFYFLIF